MKLSDFKIGKTFITETGLWQVTDVGSRVVVAVPADKEGWAVGRPPYALVETVFDEEDIIVCEPVVETV